MLVEVGAGEAYGGGAEHGGCADEGVKAEDGGRDGEGGGGVSGGEAVVFGVEVGAGKVVGGLNVFSMDGADSSEGDFAGAGDEGAEEESGEEAISDELEAPEAEAFAEDEAPEQEEEGEGIFTAPGEPFCGGGPLLGRQECAQAVVEAGFEGSNDKDGEDAGGGSDCEQGVFACGIPMPMIGKDAFEGCPWPHLQALRADLGAEGVQFFPLVVVHD